MDQSESERRLATILFADISGFTSMSEKLDPEAVTAVMNRCFEAIGAIAGAHGGTIDKFIGDCVMVLFGVPVAVEKGPHRAIRASIEILAAIDAISAEQKIPLPKPLRAHIGVNTGTVLAGEVGSTDKRSFTVMGDTVNLASRLKDLAPQGEILVGTETFAAARDEFEFGEARALHIKGKEKPVEVYQLRGPKAAGRSPSSPMVGRARELSLLLQRLPRLDLARGWVTHLVGEAGIGKTRLTQELKTALASMPVQLIDGRAVSMGRTLPYHPLADALRRWAGIVQGDSAEDGARKLRAVMASACAANVEDLYPFVARVADVPLAPAEELRLAGLAAEAVDKLVLRGLRTLLTALARTAPLVFLVEDLHWADDSTLRLLQNLYPLCPKVPLSFMATLRPGWGESGERIRHFASDCCASFSREVTVAPLEPEESEQLVDSLLATGTLSAGLRQRVVEQSGGNPFFIEELAEAMREQFQGPSTAFDAVLVPATVDEVLMTRIDRLEPRTRELLRTASVVGCSFLPRVLAEVASGAEDIEARLGQLVGAQLLRQEIRQQELHYVFKHAVAQEVTYRSLLLKQRGELHLKVAQALERLYQDRLQEHAGLIAYHAVAAGDEERSEKYLALAGEQALKAAASDEALGYLRQALDLYSKRHASERRSPRVIDLKQKMADALHARGRLGEAVTRYDEVLRDRWGYQLPRNGVLRRIYIVLCFLVFLGRLFLPFLGWKKRPDQRELDFLKLFFRRGQALSMLDPVRMTLESVPVWVRLSRYKPGATPACAVQLLQISQTFMYTGLSLGIGRRLLRMAEPQPANANDMALALNFECADLIYRLGAGDWESVRPFNDAVLKANLQNAELFVTTSYCFCYCILAIERGNLRLTEQLLATLHAMHEAFDSDYARTCEGDLRLRLFFKRRHLPALCSELERFLPFVEKTNLAPDIAVALAMGIRCALLTPDPALVERYVRRLNGIRGAARKGFPLDRNYVNAADLSYWLDAIAAGQPEAHGRASAAARLYVATAHKIMVDRVEAYRMMGEYWWAIGKRERGEAWWVRSIAEGERLGAKLELGHTYRLVADRIGDPRARQRAEDIARHLDGQEAAPEQPDRHRVA